MVSDLTQDEDRFYSIPRVNRIRVLYYLTGMYVHRNTYFVPTRLLNCLTAATTTTKNKKEEEKEEEELEEKTLIYSTGTIRISIKSGLCSWRPLSCRILRSVGVSCHESGVRIPLAPRFFRGRVIPVTYKLALQWLPCQAPGVIGSALSLVGPVSVYCDWVRWKVWSATSISVWQRVKLSVQIRPRDILTYCWDVM